MKGLLFKEFYLTRKVYLGFLGLFVGLASLGILVCLSMICGNLQSIRTENPGEMQMYFQMFAYASLAIPVIAVTAGEESIYKDYASGWMKYCYTLPAAAKKMVGVRYLMTTIIAVISLILGIGNAGIMSLILQLPITAEMLKNMLVILLVAMLYTFCGIPMAFKFKTRQATQSKVGAVMMIAYIVVAGYLFKKTIQLEGEAFDKYMTNMMMKAANIRDVCLLLAPVFMPALFALSFFLSIKLYQRREK